MFKYYLEIIKPRIIIGNIILLIGGFFCFLGDFFNFFLFLYTILGTSLVIASSCIFNNLIDREIDARMCRTRNRVLVKKLIKPIYVYILGFFLGIVGIFILGILVNFLSMLLSIIGFIIYVCLYTIFLKRKSIYSTFFGSFSGSLPSLIGYTAIHNTIDIVCFLLFIILVFWQMSHFYAISLMYLEDYKNANLPLFPILKGVKKTKKHIFYYIILYIFFSFFLMLFINFNYIFIFFISIFNFYWLYLSYLNIKSNNYYKFSKKIFYFSILIIVLFNIFICINSKF
ncbi:Protoheme IX farnesyltransferase [Buchnera aphidicola (Protaphis terricola)]|uniref:heme o synthase n=1 Tax=Buchnera aphidicola TaxID=9 RepID=UPI003463CB31